MSLPTDVEQSEVDDVREILGNSGTLNITTITNERSTSIANDSVIVRRKPIYNVIGVWLSTDTDKTGTNFYSGGSFKRYTGELTLGSTLSSSNVQVVTDYLIDSGLTDLQIARNIQFSRRIIDTETDESNDYTENTLVYDCQIYLTAWISILTLQTPNMLQSGFNYTIGDLDVQTKIWGEGMIAETVLNLYRAEVYRILDKLGRKYPVAHSDVKSLDDMTGSYTTSKRFY